MKLICLVFKFKCCNEGLTLIGFCFCELFDDEKILSLYNSKTFEKCVLSVLLKKLKTLVKVLSGTVSKKLSKKNLFFKTTLKCSCNSSGFLSNNSSKFSKKILLFFSSSFFLQRVSKHEITLSYFRDKLKFSLFKMKL